MKTNIFSKVAVTMMTVALGAGIVGSISGTIAWFQYSTRSTVAYEGAAAHCSENLQIRIRSEDSTLGKWDQDLTTSEIKTYLETAVASKGAGRAHAEQLRPVTSGELAANGVATSFYKNPIYQYPEQAKWGTATETDDFVRLPLELRVKDVTGASSDTFLAKKIYISDVTIAAAATQPTGVTNDVTPALRVGVMAGTDASALTAYTTFSKDGTAVDVSGKLDLNGDGALDKDGNYNFSAGSEITYGDDGKKANSTAISTAASTTNPTVADDSDPYSITGKEIGSTTTTDTLKVDLYIYLEGWTKLGTTPNAIWDAATTIGYKFNVGVRFSAEAHKANE